MLYAQQLDILLLCQRIMEHFVAATLSLQPNRALDATKVIVSGCIMTVADRVMRVKATDIPSEVHSFIDCFYEMTLYDIRSH